MWINLSEKTLKIVWISLKLRKEYLESILFKLKDGSVLKDELADV